MNGMPELPEVETIARQLSVVVGARILRAEMGESRVVRFPGAPEMERRLAGLAILGVTRRGKFLSLLFAHGDELVIHLGMTGHLQVVRATDPVARHTHLRLVLDDGREVRYDDSRRFGRLAMGRHTELVARRVLPTLAKEPLGQWTGGDLSRALGSSRQPVKVALLDQGRVAGLGNIYVDESLWRARVHPLRPANSLSSKELRRLHRAIRQVLRLAIEAGGSSIDDYRDARGEKGRMQDQLQVYGRQGQPCRRCGRPVEKLTLAGRGTHFCARCQPSATVLAGERAGFPVVTGLSPSRVAGATSLQ